MNLTRTAIHRPVTVSMFVIAVILFGVVSLERLPLNLLPEISYPSLTIRTEYPDTGPVEVESLITRRIEEQVGVVPGSAATQLHLALRGVGSRPRVRLGHQHGSGELGRARETRPNRSARRR